ncbi:MAG: hypothetical protein OXE57_04290 [Alphaproteobacteria bacterium]|nr:hypothetical protein [Alphaproteobacteria bacterium]
MNAVIPRPPKVEMDFTDAQLTGFGGWSCPRDGVMRTCQNASMQSLLRELGRNPALLLRF